MNTAHQPSRNTVTLQAEPFPDSSPLPVSCIPKSPPLLSPGAPRPVLPRFAVCGRRAAPGAQLMRSFIWPRAPAAEGRPAAPTAGQGTGRQGRGDGGHTSAGTVDSLARSRPPSRAAVDRVGIATGAWSQQMRRRNEECTTATECTG